MTKIFDGLAWMGDQMVRPFRPFLLRFIEVTGIEPALEKTLRWLSKRLPSR